MGSAISRRWGLTDEEILALPRYQAGPLFSELDKIVLDYAVGRWMSLAKSAFSFIESSLLFQDVLGSVALVVLESPEQHKRRPQRVGLLVAAREEHEHWLADHDALQVVQHVVRANVREDLADTGEKKMSKSPWGTPPSASLARIAGAMWRASPGATRGSQPCPAPVRGRAGDPRPRDP